MKKTISLRKFNMKSLVVSNFLLERERERERENAPYRRSARRFRHTSASVDSGLPYAAAQAASACTTLTNNIFYQEISSRERGNLFVVSGEKSSELYLGQRKRVVAVVASFLLFALVTLLLPFTAKAQQVSVRTNLLYWATGTPNAGVEVKLHDRWSLGVHGGYNPFLYRSWQDEAGNTYNPKMIHWTVMPEAKFWFCKTFERSYLGLHGVYGEFNVGALRIIPQLKHERYWGNMYGIGLSYGYQLPLGKRGGVEFSIGAGWVRINYNRCDAWVCGADLGKAHRNYFGPTKAAITFSYYLR